MSVLSDAVVGTISNVINRVLPDQAAKDAANFQLQQLNQTGELAQLTATTDLAKGQLVVNAAEAANTNVFTSGWRPMVGWVCAAGLGYTFLVAPIGTWVAALLGHPIAMPTLNGDILQTLLFGMLGLGTLRTAEKFKGVAS